MRAMHLIAAVTFATMAFGIPARAPAAVGDPLMPLYVYAGAYDQPSVATVVNCTNFSGTSQTLGYAVLNIVGGVMVNTTQVIANLTERAASTHPTTMFFDALSLEARFIAPGTLVVFATDARIVCTAMILDAAASVPNGINLHGVRFNAWPGGQE